MRIIIAGCGKVGYALAEQLNEEGHELTIIDTKEEKCKIIQDTLDVMCVQGNATSFRIQTEAGIQQADLLIAVTNRDEVNLLCCLIARKAGKCQTIARVRDPGYYAEIGFIKEELGLSMVINPELSAAMDISRLIRIPSAMEIDTLARGKVDIIRLRITDKSPWKGKKVRQAAAMFDGSILICIVERADNRETIIPDGSTILEEGDYISVIVQPEKLKNLFAAVGVQNKLIKSVMIAGGGTLAYYLANQLLSSRIQVKIIENSRERCEELSELLPKAIIIYGDASSTDLLKEEGLESVDAFVSLTGYDEENVMLSYYAGQVSDAKVITKINRVNYGGIIDSFPLGSVVSPKHLTQELIIQYVRSRQNSLESGVEAVYRLGDNQVEALEFHVDEESIVTGKPLAELVTKNHLLLCNIVRHGKFIIPSGQDRIMKGDTLIVVTTHKGLTCLQDILD